ncbi:MAG TPA: hypothetical protein VFW96_17650 [Thermomicrobiales bacterium]|nr:hypothetical protein [Thermomicrobiales bacterium]
MDRAAVIGAVATGRRIVPRVARGGAPAFFDGTNPVGARPVPPGPRVVGGEA